MECSELKSSILTWFGNEIECRQDSGTLTAVLPIFQPNGDAIEIGVRPLDAGNLRISDLGIAHETLYLSGINLTEDTERTDEFEQLVKDYQITNSDSELSLIVSQDNLGESLFDFASALQSMLALQFTIRTQLPSRDFSAIVAKFLAEQKAEFTIPPEPVEGKTGKWKFNFSLNHVGNTLMKTITATTPTQAMRSSEQSVFEIRDVRELRAINAVAVIDDEGERDRLWKPRVFRVFEGYEIPVIPFQAGRDRLIALARSHS